MKEDDLFSLPDYRLHRAGQETSAEALAKTRKARQSRQYKVYIALLDCGDKGAIPEELAKQTGIELIDVRRCFCVLKKIGAISHNNECRLNDKNNYCEVYVGNKDFYS